MGSQPGTHDQGPHRGHSRGHMIRGHMGVTAGGHMIRGHAGVTSRGTYDQGHVVVTARGTHDQGLRLSEAQNTDSANASALLASGIPSSGETVLGPGEGQTQT